MADVAQGHPRVTEYMDPKPVATYDDLKALHTNHGYVPDLAIENDAPVCETCGDGMEHHDHEAMIVESWHRYRKALERLTAAQEDFDACDCGDDQPAMFHADDCPMFERWLAAYNELAALDPEAA